LTPTLSVVSTRREEWVDITPLVEEALAKEQVQDGLLHLFCPHTTAGLLVNEGYDPDVAKDVHCFFQNLVPREGWKHAEGNADAHIKAILTGSSLTLPLQKGVLLLGRWQRIFFAEYDGPRRRNIHLSLLKS